MVIFFSRVLQILLGAAENLLVEEVDVGWRDGSAAGKSANCSSRGPEFSSQQPHGGSQPSLMGSDALFCCV
jgi:hypothetical protein